MTRGWALGTLAVAALLAGGAVAASAPAGGAAAPAAYCRAKGGVVQVRVPVYGTNNPRGTPLAGSLAFCQFTSSRDHSRIAVDLRTLTATGPTLAALAYYQRTPAGKLSPNANPASTYCSRVGGTDLFGGVNAAGGGWVLRGRANSTALDVCVFPDLSTIDAFGLFYRSGGIVRGADLSTVLRYRPPDK